MPLAVNACSQIYKDNTGEINRYFIIILMSIQLSIFALLWICSIINRDNHEKAIEKIMINRRHKEQLKIQDIQHIHFEDQSSLHFKNQNILKCLSTKPEQMQQREEEQDKKYKSESSSQQNTQNTDVTISNQKNFAFIDVKNIKWSFEETSNFLNIVIGHQFICWLFVLIHFPYFYASCFCLLQTICSTILVLTKICHMQKDRQESSTFQRIILGTIWISNLFLINFGIYGLNNARINKNQSYCFSQ